MENIDFSYGMKVTLNDEVGIVVKDKLDKPDYIGLIRWDTSKPNDFEDWRGLFGSFINSGGKVINDDYNLKYINNDGSLK